MPPDVRHPLQQPAMGRLGPGGSGHLRGWDRHGSLRRYPAAQVRDQEREAQEAGRANRPHPRGWPLALLSPPKLRRRAALVVGAVPLRLEPGPGVDVRRTARQQPLPCLRHRPRRAPHAQAGASCPGLQNVPEEHLRVDPLVQEPRAGAKGQGDLGVHCCCSPCMHVKLVVTFCCVLRTRRFIRSAQFTLHDYLYEFKVEINNVSIFIRPCLKLVCSSHLIHVNAHT
jgi:hypothetical protein